MTKLYVAEWRRWRGLSQEQLATQSECSVDTIARVEQGKQHPREKTKSRIAEALGLYAWQLGQPPQDDTLSAVLRAWFDESDTQQVSEGPHPSRAKEPSEIDARADELYDELTAIEPGTTITRGQYQLSCDAKDGFELFVEKDGQPSRVVNLSDQQGLFQLTDAIVRDELALPVGPAEYGEPTTDEEFAEAMTPYEATSA
jgi:transcriptional regulator with XRE-family HTH domain